MIAKELGLGPRDMRTIEIGSLLHDVGKIGIDDRILRKPSVLTEEENRYMKQHPEKGASMLAPIKNMNNERNCPAENGPTRQAASGTLNISPMIRSAA